MEIFKTKGDENNLWMGFNPTHGWVILDRNLPGNKVSYGGDLFFIKCDDWSVYKDTHSNWEPPNYSYVVRYIDSLTNDKNKVQEEALNKLNEYINQKKNEIQFEFLKTIHNNYLEKKGLSPRSIVKTTTNRRRISHCWECKNTVDSKVDYECETCRWIVCDNCGACKLGGCG